jgi:RimJ/RimL family protein N-acetyltransferase
MRRIGWLGISAPGLRPRSHGEVIRRLRLDPQVQLIGTRHRRDNEAAANLYRNLGFGPWKVPWQNADPDEVYVALHDVGRAGL